MVHLAEAKNDRIDRGDRNRNRRRKGGDRQPGQGQGQNQGKDRDRNRGGMPQSSSHAPHFQPKQNFAQPRNDRDQSRQAPRHQQSMNPANNHPAQPRVQPVTPHAPGPHLTTPAVIVPPALDSIPALRPATQAFPTLDVRPVVPSMPASTPAAHSEAHLDSNAAIPESVASAVELSSLGSEANPHHKEPLVAEDTAPASEVPARTPPENSEVVEGDSNYAESMADESTGIYESASETSDYLDAIETPLEPVVVDSVDSLQVQIVETIEPAVEHSSEVSTEAVEGAATQVAPGERTGGQQSPRQKTSRNWRESTYESSTVAPQVAPPTVRKVVLLNSTEPGEIRVAILENGELAEIFMERKSHYQQAGNIYKGRVVNVEPSLQAAFIDLGAERNGFLHASDVIPPNGGYADVLDKKIPEKGRQRQFDQPRDHAPQAPRENRESRDNRDNREPRENRDSQAPREQRERGATPPSVLAAQQLSKNQPYAAPTAPGAPQRGYADGPLLLNRPARPMPRPGNVYVQPLQPGTMEVPVTGNAGVSPVTPQAGPDIDPAMPIVPGQPFPNQAPSAGQVPNAGGAPNFIPGALPGQPGYQSAEFQNRESKRRRRRRGGRGRANRARLPGATPMLAPQSKFSTPTGNDGEPNPAGSIDSNVLHAGAATSNFDDEFESDEDDENQDTAGSTEISTQPVVAEQALGTPTGDVAEDLIPHSNVPASNQEAATTSTESAPAAHSKPNAHQSTVSAAAVEDRHAPQNLIHTPETPVAQPEAPVSELKSPDVEVHPVHSEAAPVIETPAVETSQKNDADVIVPAVEPSAPAAVETQTVAAEYKTETHTESAPFENSSAAQTHETNVAAEPSQAATTESTSSDAPNSSTGTTESTPSDQTAPSAVEATSESVQSFQTSQDDVIDRMDRADELADQLEEDEEQQPQSASSESNDPAAFASEDEEPVPAHVHEEDESVQTRSHHAIVASDENGPNLDADESVTASISDILTKSFEPVAAAAVLAEPQRQNQQRKNNGGRKDRAYDRRYTIQEMLREGQEVLVQVAKEGIGQKGPALTTYISLPGRYLVLMPAVSRLGVSKRIDSEEQRRALKEALSQLNPPDDMGVIVRTAGMGRTKDELQRDMEYLMRAWNGLKDKTKASKAPNLIYQEGDVVTRVFRDVLTEDVTEIIIDDPIVMERAREFLRETSPGSEKKLKLYADPEPLFHRHGVEQQMQRLFNRKVNLKNGGSIVIEQTEALVAIDVNTGRFREKRNQDDTILQTNLEAAREIARQLRLRDIGGLVMIDFIDMEISEHKRKVERELKSYLARDKAKINVLPVSSLGVVEMTRQRIRHSLKKTLFDRCPHCSGSGHIKSPESIGLEMLREIKSQVRDKTIRKVKVLLNSHVAYGILNQFRKELVRMEEANRITIEVCGDPGVALSQMQVSIAKEGGDWVLKKVSEVDDYVRNS